VDFFCFSERKYFRGTSLKKQKPLKPVSVAHGFHPGNNIAVGTNALKKNEQSLIWLLISILFGCS